MNENVSQLSIMLKFLVTIKKKENWQDYIVTVRYGPSIERSVATPVGQCITYSLNFDAKIIASEITS